MNGYDFHVGLMAGSEKWTDPKVKAVFEKWRELLPYFQEGALGRTWQDARPGCPGRQDSRHVLPGHVRGRAGPVDDAADVDFFPFPTLGTEFDAENAIDAPIDGFLLSAKPKNPEAAKAFLRCVGTPAAQVVYVTTTGIGERCGLADAPTRAGTTMSRRRPRSVLKTPARSPSSSIATPGPTSPDRPACRAS